MSRIGHIYEWQPNLFEYWISSSMSTFVLEFLCNDNYKTMSFILTIHYYRSSANLTISHRDLANAYSIVKNRLWMVKIWQVLLLMIGRIFRISLFHAELIYSILRWRSAEVLNQAEHFVDACVCVMPRQCLFHPGQKLSTLCIGTTTLLRLENNGIVISV
jgi:hypothetical protein